LSPDSDKHRIMVVDDDKDILTVTSTALELFGFEVHGFSDPIVALQHVENGCEDCEVLVSDIKMPNMTGFQLVRRTKELRPDMKVIMMTAFEVNKPEFESVFPSTPVDNVMRKPFLPSQLAEVIKEIYRQSQNAGG
jgi:DNA-binding NtrC family response regulator